MDAIFSPVSTAQRQIKTRASQLIITNPAVGDVNIRFRGENLLLLDGQPTAPLPCPDVVRNLMGVAGEVKSIQDPVTGEVVSISVAGLAEAIVKCFCDWYQEDDAKRAAAVAAAAKAQRLADEATAKAIAEDEAAGDVDAP